MKESMPHNWSTARHDGSLTSGSLPWSRWPRSPRSPALAGYWPWASKRARPSSRPACREVLSRIPRNRGPLTNRWPSRSLPTRVKAVKGRGTTGRSFADPLRSSVPGAVGRLSSGATTVRRPAMRGQLSNPPRRRPVPAAAAISHGRPQARSSLRGEPGLRTGELGPAR